MIAIDRCLDQRPPENTSFFYLSLDHEFNTEFKWSICTGGRWSEAPAFPAYRINSGNFTVILRDSIILRVGQDIASALKNFPLSAQNVYNDETGASVLTMKFGFLREGKLVLTDSRIMIKYKNNIIIQIRESTIN